MKENPTDVLQKTDMLALERKTAYKYLIMPEKEYEQPVLVQIDENISLQKGTPPLYDVFINGHHIIISKKYTDMPLRFLQIINNIDYYIDNHIVKRPL